MAEQTFRSPNFFENEIDLSGKQEATLGTPAGIIGTADKGPAFVPITVGSYEDFKFRFGGLNPKKFGPYAVREFMKHRSAVTFMRVLGAGANSTSADIERTTLTGQVKSAGFIVTGTVAVAATDLRHKGAVQYIVAKHSLSDREAFGLPMFTHNASYSGATAYMVRGVVLTTQDARFMVLSGSQAATSPALTGQGPKDAAAIESGKFKLVLSTSAGSTWASTDGNVGVKIFTASLDPSSSDYFGKILNTDPEKFSTYKHVLYADFAVDNEIASGTIVGVVSGSTNTSATSGNTTMLFRDAFGHFDTRFAAPRSTHIISQPFGKSEYDLFYFEGCDDGEAANTLYKISITNIRASNNPSDPYGTFTVLVRDWTDTDASQKVLERYPNVSLNPTSPNYIAKAIGDRKVSYNFDATDLSERRLIISGKYPNKSTRIRVVMTDGVDRKLVPAESLPFGFRGFEVPKFTDTLTNTVTSNARLGGALTGSDGSLTGSIVPPIPFRFKVTKGDVAQSGVPGNPGNSEAVNPSYTWGVKFERNNEPLNPNISADKNSLIAAFTKVLGLKKLDTLVTGSGADTMNENKFTLARVALGNTSLQDLTASIVTHMREAAYIRNGRVDPVTYKVSDGTNQRITFGTLLAATASITFNQFSQFAKFTTFMAGGFDGVNILDVDAKRLNDKSSAFEGGGAESGFTAPGLAYGPSGTGTDNNTVYSYQHAITMMTDPFIVNTNILITPGMRESFITDYASTKVREYGMAIYLMDLAKHDSNDNRLFDDSTSKPDVSKVISNFESRVIDNNYVSTCFPDVVIDDPENDRKIKVPASIAQLAALAFNDRVSYPWYAPAGFNRAALDFVSNVEVRLNTTDRDKLYDSRINPIATFPNQGFVVWGQKTLQQMRSALDRVNVRRLVLELKRIVTQTGRRITFDQGVESASSKFKNSVGPQLAIIKTQAGLEGFEIIMDSRNNSDEDRENYRLNGTIRIIPTRTIEFISIDFIITNSGVQFV